MIRRALVAVVVLAALAQVGCGPPHVKTPPVHRKIRPVKPSVDIPGVGLPERPIPLPVHPPLPVERPTEEVARSAAHLSKETALDPEETKNRYCHLLEVHESGGSTGAFLEWALDELDLPEPASFRAVMAVKDLEEAIVDAEKENTLGLMVFSYCLPGG